MIKKLTQDQQKEVKKEVDKQLKSAEKQIERNIEKKIEKKVEARLHKKLTKRIHKHSTFIASKFKEHASTAIIAAFSFLIAIVWKDLIVKVVRENIKLSSLEKYPYLAELYSAAIVTVIAIICITIIAHWATKEDN